MEQGMLCLDNWGIRKVVEAPPAVEVLSLRNNRLKALGAVTACNTLLELSLSGNRFEEAALVPLAALPDLRVLDVSRNRLQGLGRLFLGIGPLGGSGSSSDCFPRLEVLVVSENLALADISPAFALPRLRVLRAASVNATALSCRPCPSLEVLDMGSCSVANIDQLSVLPALRELVLDGNALLSGRGVFDIAQPRLETLRLAQNAIQEAPPLRLPSLKTLDIASNQLRQVPALEGAWSLTSLSLSDNALVSLSALAPLRSLTFLDASRNRLPGLEPSLAANVLRSMRVLDLRCNNIERLVDVVDGLSRVDRPALEHLDVRGNPVSFAFYPEAAERLPAWTWDAEMTLDALSRLGGSVQLDAGTQEALESYRSSFAVVCPALRSLDGLLVAVRERSRPIDQSAQAAMIEGRAVSVQAATPGELLAPDLRSPDFPAPDLRTWSQQTHSVHGRESDEVVYFTPRLSIEGGPPGPPRIPAAAAAPLDERGRPLPYVPGDRTPSVVSCPSPAPHYARQRDRIESNAGTERSRDREVGSQYTLPLTETDRFESFLASERSRDRDHVSQRSDSPRFTERVRLESLLGTCTDQRSAQSSPGRRSDAPHFADIDRFESLQGTERSVRHRSDTPLLTERSVSKTSQRSAMPSPHVELESALRFGLDELTERSVSKTSQRSAVPSPFTGQEPALSFGLDELPREATEVLREQHIEMEPDQDRNALRSVVASSRRPSDAHSTRSSLRRPSNAHSPFDERDDASIPVLEARAPSVTSWRQGTDSRPETPFSSRPSSPRRQVSIGFEPSPDEPTPFARSVGSTAQPRQQPAASEAGSSRKSLQGGRQPAASEPAEQAVAKSDETPALTGRRAYLKFLEDEIVAQRAFLKMHRNSRLRRSNGSASDRRLFGSSALQANVSTTRRRSDASSANQANGWKPYTMGNILRRRDAQMHDGAFTARAFEADTPTFSIARSRTPDRPARKAHESTHEQHAGRRASDSRSRRKRSGARSTAELRWERESDNGSLMAEFHWESSSDRPHRSDAESSRRVLVERARSGSSDSSPGDDAGAHFSSEDEHSNAFARSGLSLYGGAENAWCNFSPQSQESGDRIVTGPLLCDAAQFGPLKPEAAPTRKAHCWNAEEVSQGLAEVQEFSQRTPAVPSSLLRDVKIIESDGASVGAGAQPTQASRFTSHTLASVMAQADGASLLGAGKEWHAIVTPVVNESRQSLEELIAQQAWAVPGRPVVYRYSLDRAVQTDVGSARSCFQALAARDEARSGATPARLSHQQRAFFCGDAQRLAEVISSPFGFAPVFEGMVLLFAFDLRHAEALSANCDWAPCDCGASAPPKLIGRALVAELALGKCHTAKKTLQDAVQGRKLSERCGGAVPFGPVFEDAYRGGADSLYFPQSGVVALLNPMRALPLFLAEYRRERSSVVRGGSEQVRRVRGRSSRRKGGLRV